MKTSFLHLQSRLIDYGVLSPSSGSDASWEPLKSLETNMTDFQISLIIPLIEQVKIARDRVTKEAIKKVTKEAIEKAIDDLEKW